MSISLDEKTKHNQCTLLNSSEIAAAHPGRASRSFQRPTHKLDDEVDLFGMKLNNMAIVLIIGGHANEHLGQLIAYARSNDIAPPWSR